MHRAGRLFIVALAICGLGCGEATTVIGGKPRPKFYRAIVSLSPGTTEIALQYGTARAVVGRTASDDFPAFQVAKIPIVASVKPDYEKIAEIKPDLILYDSLLYNDQDVAKIKAIGADLFVISANTVDEFITELYKYGSLVAGETNVSTYVDRILAARSSAQGDAAGTKIKVAVIMPGQGSEHMIAGTDSFVADLVRAAGAEPVGPKADRFVNLSPEFLVSQNPDIIISSGNGAAILADARLATVTAVKNRRVIAVKPDVLLRRGSRVDKMIDAFHEAFGAKK